MRLLKLSISVSHYPFGAKEVTPVFVVTLNRPDKQNAFTLQMVEGSGYRQTARGEISKNVRNVLVLW